MKSGGALYWKTLGFTWFKKAKIALETISDKYFQIFFIFICNENYQWNLFNFSKFTYTFIRKEQKQSNKERETIKRKNTAVIEKRKIEKIFTLLCNKLSYQAL